MLPQVYESEPLHYAAYSPGVAGGYNAYLRTPPRVYDEALQSHSPFLGCFARAVNSLSAEVVYHVVCNMDYVHFPSFKLWVERFDGMSGAYIDRVDKTTAVGAGISYSTTYVSQGRNNELWGLYLGSWIQVLDPETWNWTGDSADRYNLTDFTPHIPGAPYAIDRVADRVVARALSNAVNVYRLSDGVQLATIPMPGNPRSIFLEDSNHAYIAFDYGVLVLLDYAGLRVLGIYRAHDAATTGVGENATWCWDPLARRILVCVATADAADGAATARILGFFPRPQPVAVTPPIPLGVPRAGRTIDVVARLYGDVGEGFAGAEMIVESMDSTATITGQKRITDRRGYVRAPVEFTATGSAVVAISTES